jgi:hypothetical protein
MPFVVIALPRTGSSHYINMLSGHPAVFTNGNVPDDRKTLYTFWPDMTAQVKANLIRLAPGRSRGIPPADFLHGLWTKACGLQDIPGREGRDPFEAADRSGRQEDHPVPQEHTRLLFIRAHRVCHWAIQNAGRKGAEGAATSPLPPKKSATSTTDIFPSTPR